MPDRPLTILLAGGGTGGHVFPAIAIADAIRSLRPDARIVFAGTKNRMEARLVPKFGYPLETVWISGVRRRFSLDNLLIPLKVMVSLVQSVLLLRRHRPAVVIGTGGYVCGPVLFASTMMGIPTVLHESNSYPGVTTRMLAGRVQRIFLAFEDAVRWLPPGITTEVVGTPTRDAIESVTRAEALTFFGLDGSRPVLLVTGGSQGATAINAAIRDMAETLQTNGVQLIWQTGERDFTGLTGDGTRTSGWIGPFLENMAMAYAAADLVLCRSGATTIAELTRAGKPSVLVPYPHAAGDHQTRNAESLVRSGAAVLVAERNMASLKDTIMGLLRDTERRRAMSSAARSLARPDAALRVARSVLSMAAGVS